MAPEMRTEDWQAAENIEKLKALPENANNAIPILAQSMIFFGRQVVDLKNDMREMPERILDAMETRHAKSNTPVTSKGMAALFGLGAGGTGTGFLGVLIYVIGQTKGWW